MAVLTTETPVTMWDKVDARLAGATPAAQMVFRAFKSWCMQHLRGINLQLLDIADLNAFTNPLDGTLRCYALYLRKSNTATATYVKLFDDATNDAVAGAARLAIGLTAARQSVFLFYPDGLPVVNGVVLGGYTALIGSNATTPSTAGDGANGFMLVG